MALPDGWTTGTVDANGIEVRYYRSGDGPPIVMAHGMFDDGRRWLPLGSTLSDSFDVVAFDARGHGRSDAPETGYDIETRTADLFGLVDALSLDDPILLGHSMGAATVAWAAASRPTVPRGLILVDPSHYRSEPPVSEAELRDAALDRLSASKALSVEERIAADDLDEPFGTRHARRLAEAVDACSPNVANLAQGCDPICEAFPDITCPTLVLRRDLDVDERVPDLRVADRLDDGRLVHVPHAGHYVFRDANDAAVAELRTFLARIDGSEAAPTDRSTE
ncbi:alpha/beta fold hydrolase [Halovivax gelatinilyticus]|uniref:alpha/beta fold hydrolase n=1 Tax=Halovivax gelatinilyticus TaxID=2961597 RepID=UPI0020CA7F76|nr:alpha/beta hydrolase [Halovivax gelatinilyticus]